MGGRASTVRETLGKEEIDALWMGLAMKGSLIF